MCLTIHNYYVWLWPCNWIGRYTRWTTLRCEMRQILAGMLCISMLASHNVRSHDDAQCTILSMPPTLDKIKRKKRTMLMHWANCATILVLGCFMQTTVQCPKIHYRSDVKCFTSDACNCYVYELYHSISTIYNIKPECDSYWNSFNVKWNSDLLQTRIKAHVGLKVRISTNDAAAWFISILHSSQQTSKQVFINKTCNNTPLQMCNSQLAEEHWLQSNHTTPRPNRFLANTLTRSILYHCVQFAENV